MNILEHYFYQILFLLSIYLKKEEDEVGEK